MRRVAAIWTGIAALVVLATHTIVYAASPSESQIVGELEHKAGPPELTLGLAGIAVAAGLIAVAVLWLAVIAVRERVALERHELVVAPCLRPFVLAGRAVVLFGATSFAFAMVESTIHWREGLGWHGISCLTGPIHRDAIPVLAGLSLLATSLHGAIEHLLAWARRLVILLAPRLPLLRGAGRIFVAAAAPRQRFAVSGARPRGPPVGSFSTI
jgi:hypothetical protein